MNYKDACDFLLTLPDMERTSHGDMARTMSLESMRSLLGRLGNPQLGRKTVHVTGSKGKGSTSAMIAAMLSADTTCSLYTSPHLHSYRERICFNVAPVTAEEFAEGVEAIKPAVMAENESALGPTSTFGAMTSLFFHLSAKHQVQWQVVEVGMGGRTDATNVFDTKDLVVITAVSLEHTNVLGKSTVEIAENKAGIIRFGSIVVLAPQHDPAVTELIKKICKEQNVRVVDVASEYVIEEGKVDALSQTFTLSPSANCTISDLPAREFNIKMLGRHQLDNAATAVAAMDVLASKSQTTASARALKEALESVSVPGRMELLSDDPFVLIDGAHNGESMEALVEGLKRHYQVDKAVFVLGVNSDKNIKEILTAIKPACKYLIATRSVSQKAMDPKLIDAEAKTLGIASSVVESSADSLKYGMGAAGAGGAVCATGSLYLLAEIREYYLGDNPSWSLVPQVQETNAV